MALDVPEKFAKYLVSQPEAGMGHQIVNIILKDGRQFNQVRITEGHITKIRGMVKIPFKAEEIDQIIVTNEKWGYSKE